MSYTPPTGNAADFDFAGAGYSPPAGNAVDFNFGAIAGADLAASSTLSFATSAPLTLPLELTAAATLSLAALPALLTTGISLSAAATIVFTALPALLDGGELPEVEEPDLAAGGASASDYRRGGKRISLDLDLDRRRKRRRKPRAEEVVEPSRTDELAARAQERALPHNDEATAAQVIAHNRAAVAFVLNLLEA